MPLAKFNYHVPNDAPSFVVRENTIEAGCKAGLGFVTAFENRRTMQTFVSHIAWESEVWIAEDPDHMIHFNGERFLGPYADVTPKGA